MAHVWRPQQLWVGWSVRFVWRARLDFLVVGSRLPPLPQWLPGVEGVSPSDFYRMDEHGDLNNYGWAGLFTLNGRNGLTNRWWSNASRISYSLSFPCPFAIYSAPAG